MTEKTTNPQKSINRREMLKKGALAAGGAITAAAFLDGKWLKPIVKTGVLPVHAQASMCAEYDFTPVFTYQLNGNIAFVGTGIVFELGVNVVPVPPNGPITYKILQTVGVTLTPTGVNLTSNLVNGHAKFDGSYSVIDPLPGGYITVEWTLGGCCYTQNYSYNPPNNIDGANLEF